MFSNKVNKNAFRKDTKLKSCREGFGEGIVETALKDERIVVLAADLKDSVKLTDFSKKFPNRFIQVGIAEQNMAGIAAGLAMSGKIPFIVSHAAFNPYRNWDQIRLSIASQNLDVKIVGSHAGFSNGPDGLSAEPLEDIAIMRTLPNMKVINTIDFNQTKNSISVIAKEKGPVYLRFCKADTPQITFQNTKFLIGKSEVLSIGKDVTLVVCGTLVYEALIACRNLKVKHHIEVEVISSPTIKPLDEETILESAIKTGKIITLEEHQITGGLGGAVCEMISDKMPLPIKRMGVKDTFGESGDYKDLLDKYGLRSQHIEKAVLSFIKENKNA